jgi:hypothetical protein
MTVPLYQLSDIWSDVAQAYAAIRMNVSDGGHADGSLLLDLQRNGISQFSVEPDGALVILSDIKFVRDASQAPGAQPGTALALRSGTKAQTLRVYNTYTDDNNFERGFFGWVAAPNVLGIGNVGVGSGITRPIQLIGSNILLSGYNPAGSPVTNNDVGIFRAAPGCVEVNNGSPHGMQGAFIKWGGTARVIGDFNIGAAMTDVGGLVINLNANRAYSFDIELSFTCAAAGGIQCTLGGSVGITNLIFDGWIQDSANNGTKGSNRGSAFGNAVANSTLVGTSGHVVIRGCIETSATAGTFQVRAAQFASNATNTIIKRGSRLIAHDIT